LIDYVTDLWMNDVAATDRGGAAGRKRERRDGISSQSIRLALIAGISIASALTEAQAGSIGGVTTAKPVSAGPVNLILKVATTPTR
jgi:hypothetical protein